MRAAVLTTLFLISALCGNGQRDCRNAEYVILEAGYDEMKLFFESWSQKPGVETMEIPRSFNWLIKRKLRKELESAGNSSSAVAQIIDSMESIAMMDYGGLKETERELLENELYGILSIEKGSFSSTIILSGRNADEKVYSRMIFHSQESKAFIIIKGMFSFEKNECEN